MDNFDFDKIVYRRPFYTSGKRYIKEVIGLDSETLTSGRPFLFCTSLGDSFTSADVPGIFFGRKYRGKNLVCYNLKFDSGSLLYNLPLENLDELREKTFTIYDGYHYTYIPHKLLRIRKGKNAVSFWDIFGFYKTSLDKAAKKHLGVGKTDIETKRFTLAYIKSNLDKIK